ncbi:hypothetical protein [Methylobacterium sp. WL120]|uniref:hypothetical protein n=1 Tax=Methylobacterium sp. WL120 TaxID=2603887 RepID=UPI00164F5F0F|nr:hypothetical protein [Methylobacterium sp. WL120]
MTDIASKAVQITNTLQARTVVPFTGGLIFFLYAFFWPEGYGRWLGTIVRGFRDVSGY